MTVQVDKAVAERFEAALVRRVWAGENCCWDDVFNLLSTLATSWGVRRTSQVYSTTLSSAGQASHRGHCERRQHRGKQAQEWDGARQRKSP